MKNVLHDKAREVLYRSNNITVFRFNEVNPIVMMDYPDRYLHTSMTIEQLEEVFNDIKMLFDNYKGK